LKFLVPVGDVVPHHTLSSWIVAQLQSIAIFIFIIIDFGIANRNEGENTSEPDALWRLALVTYHIWLRRVDLIVASGSVIRAPADAGDPRPVSLGKW
jgi:hypothetical protein